MKILLFFGFLSFLVVVEGVGCSPNNRLNGGHWYYSYRTREFYISETSKTKSFNESKAFCISQNSTLVQPKTEENQMILKSLKSVVEYKWYHGEIPSEAYSNPHTFYIGLTKINGSYYWSDDELLNYSNWNTADGEPSNDTNKLCVVYDYNGDKWKTANCGALVHGFICERQHVVNNITRHRNGNVEYYFPFNEVCVTSYESAEQYCKNIGGEIPVSADEMRIYLHSVFQATSGYNYVYFFSRESLNPIVSRYCSYTYCNDYDCRSTSYNRYCYRTDSDFIVVCQRLHVNPWSSWSKCSSSCLPGIQTRTRNKPCASNNVTQYCDVDETEKQSQPCNSHLCKNTLDRTNCDQSKLSVKECAIEFLHDIFDKAKQQNINSALTYKTYKPKDGNKLALEVGSWKKKNIRVQVVSLTKPDQDSG